MKYIKHGHGVICISNISTVISQWAGMTLGIEDHFGRSINHLSGELGRQRSRDSHFYCSVREGLDGHIDLYRTSRRENNKRRAGLFSSFSLNRVLMRILTMPTPTFKWLQLLQLDLPPSSYIGWAAPAQSCEGIQLRFRHLVANSYTFKDLHSHISVFARCMLIQGIHWII